MDLSPLETKHMRHPRRKLAFLLFLVTVELAFGLAYWAAVSKMTVVVPNEHPLESAAAPQPAHRLQLALFATGLPDPTGIVANGVSGDTRLFVLDRSGLIRVVDKDGVVSSKPFLDIRDRILASGEMGLLGLAFSPHYATDGNFFINYIDKTRHTVIARFHAISADKADANSEKNLLKIAQPFPNHKGGNLAFGPDGYLYASLGDGGSAGDPGDRAQNRSLLLGKILRLDVSSVPYKIPPTNPLVGKKGVAPEIWDYGLRNPWRFSFDSKTGELYIADVGQGRNEEVDVEPTGSAGGFNYGWRCYEAKTIYNPIGCPAKSTFTFPALSYDHSQGRCSITGGYVYRGSRYPAIVGKYFFSDYCGGQLYWAARQGKTWKTNLVIDSPYRVTTFGQDNSGELYLADFATSSIYHIED